jgi:hypothetical protein
MLKRTACVLAIAVLASCTSSAPEAEKAPVTTTPTPGTAKADRGEAAGSDEAAPAEKARDSAPAPEAPAAPAAVGRAEGKMGLGVTGSGRGGGGAGEATGLGAIGGVGGKGGGYGGKDRKAVAKGAPARPASPKPTRASKSPAKRDTLGDVKVPIFGADDDEPRKEEKPRANLPQSGQLTAGEWRDLDHWDFWRELFQGGQGQQVGPWQHTENTWGYQTARRIPVRVEVSGVPAVDAKVSLLDAKGRTVWQTRTNNRGTAQLFAGLLTNYPGPYQVVAESGGVKARSKAVPVKGNAPVVVNLPAQGQVPNGLDIMFVVDTTGSMGDELSFLQSELRDVVKRVQAKGGQNIDIRTSVNFYRDTTDEYLVRSFPFTRDVDQAVKDIEAQGAAGGGDFPEAVEEGLADAVFKHKWRPSARARLLFLVLDAPPHKEAAHLAKLHEATQDAARQGIRIIPIVGSGISKETEFLMRFLAVSTDGTYVFLTDDSGIGGSHAKPTIGPHTVEYLSHLLVKIINRHLEVEDIRPVRRAP